MMAERKVAVVRTVPFRYEVIEGGADLEQLLRDFKDIVNACIRRFMELKTTSITIIHRAIYWEFKQRYDYITRFYTTAYRVAMGLVNSWLKTGGNIPEVKKSFIMVPQWAYRFDGEILRISNKPKKFIYLKLIYGDYQKKFIEAWRQGRVKIGQIMINKEYVYVPFKQVVEVFKTEKAIAIDINEKKIVALGSDGIIFEKDISEILRIQRVYEEKRRRIDMKVARGTKTYKSLMRKYGRKEANKVKDLLHKLSKEVAEMCKGYVIVFEDLKGLRKSINKKIKRYNKFTRKVQECSMYSKKLKRTWNKLPYQQIQRYVEYKHLLNGYETKYVNRKNTSRVCSRCGSTIKSWNKTCPRCNMDRDINACINLLRKFAEGEDKK